MRAAGLSQPGEQAGRRTAWLCIPRAVPNPFPGDLQVEHFTHAMCLQLAEVTPGLSLPLLEAGPRGAVPSTSHRNSPGIPLELREEHSLTQRFAHLLPARNRLGLALLKARPEVQEGRTCFHPVDLPGQPSPPPVPPPAPPRHHQNQPQSKTGGCLQLCHLPAANPRIGALLMILTARNATRLIYFFFYLAGALPA